MRQNPSSQIKQNQQTPIPAREGTTVPTDNFYSFKKGDTHSMSKSAFIVQRDQGQNKCINCTFLQKQLNESKLLINSYHAECQFLIQQIKFFEDQEHSVQQQGKNSDRLRQLQEEIIMYRKDIQRQQEQYHQKLLENGSLQKEIMELKRQGLNFEQQLLMVNNNYEHSEHQLNAESVQNELTQMKKQNSSDRKFVESFLHLVNSCQPDYPGQQLDLKSSWKWLKCILHDYMLLKQSEVKTFKKKN